MNKIRKQRVVMIGLFAFGISLSMTLILYALKQNINIFLTPSEIHSTPPKVNYPFRLGGVVKKNSLNHFKNKLGMTFIVTDFKHDTLL